MKIESVIELMNIALQKELEGHFILLKQVTANQLFKVYKNFTYILWYIDTKNNIKERALTFNWVDKVLQNDIDDVLKFYDLLFMRGIFKFIYNRDYEVLKKLYNEHTDE